MCDITLSTYAFKSNLRRYTKEGLYAWVAANYAAETLWQGDPANTLGVLEWGRGYTRPLFSSTRADSDTEYTLTPPNTL